MPKAMTCLLLAGVLVALVPRLSEADGVRDLFGPMGTFTEGRSVQGDEQIIPLPSINEVERAAKSYRLPRNIIRAYKEQGFDPETAAASIISRLDRGEDFEMIVPESIRTRAAEMVEEMEGVETFGETLLGMSGGLLGEREKKILFVEFLRADGLGITMVAEYQAAECQKLLQVLEAGLQAECPDCRRGIFDCDAPVSEEVRALKSKGTFVVPYVAETSGKHDKFYFFGNKTRPELSKLCEETSARFVRAGREASCIH